MTLHIRNLQQADCEAAARVAQAAFGWNESHLEDLHRYFEIQPDGYFIAEQGGVILGMVGAVDYGSFAYIGHMAVQPEFQSHGIGHRLMTHLLAWLEERGVPALLDASDKGYPLYAKLGFIETDLVCVYVQTQPLEIAYALPQAVEEIGLQHLDELAEFDAPYFGADRKRVLFYLLRDFPGRALAVRDRTGRLSGYLIAQDRRLGPWVARGAEEASALLLVALSWLLPGAPILTQPQLNSEGRELVHRLGFRQVRTLRHMQRGEIPLRQRAHMYGLASFALG